jgi:hypothetical protein
MGGGEEYECPDCGSSFTYGAENCPDCGVDFDWDDTEGVEIGTDRLRLVDPRLPPEEVEKVPVEPIFTPWGTMFALLTVAAFVGTVLLMNWDTWVRGAAEASIGYSQRMLIYAGAVVTTVFAVLAIIDILRGHGKPGGVPE